MNTQNDIHTHLREGDSGLGIPQSIPTPLRVLPDTETKAYQVQRETEEAQEARSSQIRQYAEEMKITLEAEEGFLLPKSVQKAFSFILLLLISFLGLIMVSETVQFFASLNTLPPSLYVLCMTLFLFFAFIFVGLIFTLFKKFVQLQMSPRINAKALQVLAERKYMQDVVRENQISAQKIFEKYLKTYPNEIQHESKLRRMGMEAGQYTDLMATQKRLLESELIQSPADWCHTFQNSFQGLLDEVARKHVKSYAIKVAIGTGASPMSMIDRMIVLYSSFAMIKDLLTLYHVRPATGQSFVIFSKAIILAYLSGIIEEGTEALADSIDDLTGTSLDTVTGTLATAVSAKAAEASLNGFFIRRLGNRTIKLLQPVQG